MHTLSLHIERELGTLIVAAQAHYVTENISLVGFREKQPSVNNYQHSASWTPSTMISSPTVRAEEIDGCSSNGGRARPADDFRGMHGPDPESCGRARSTREVAHLLRRRDVARDLLLRKLLGTRSPPSVGAVTQTSDRRRRTRLSIIGRHGPMMLPLLVHDHVRSGKPPDD